MSKQLRLIRSELLLVVLAGCLDHAPAGPTLPRDALQQEADTVVVDVLCAWGEGVALQTEYHGGSGFVVGPRHVMTAAHLVTCPAPPQVRVFFGDGTSLRFVAVRYDNGTDLALLELVSAGVLPGSRTRPVVGVPVVGEPLCVVTGRPRRGEHHCGTVEQVLEHGDDNVVHSARSEFGNSGSACYDLQGRVIGVATYIRDRKNPDGGGRCSTIRPGWIP